jgi:hypothetical protein
MRWCIGFSEEMKCNIINRFGFACSAAAAAPGIQVALRVAD